MNRGLRVANGNWWVLLVAVAGRPVRRRARLRWAIQLSTLCASCMCMSGPGYRIGLESKYCHGMYRCGARDMALVIVCWSSTI